MPKLYYHPNSSALASFIAAVAADIRLDVEQVSVYTDHKTDSGVDFYSINPKGNVPCLVLDDGTILNEGSAVLQYIADQVPEQLAGLPESTERYQIQNILNFLASEVQVAYNPLFSTPAGELKDMLTQKALSKLEYIEKHVLKGQYLVGDSFSIVDAQFYTILSCSDFVGIDLVAYPALKVYYEFIASLPCVIRTHAVMATHPSKI